MGPWTGVVLPLTEPGSEDLNSSLPAHLHPVAGRPLVWHTVRAVASLVPAPERVVVVMDPGASSAELFADLPGRVEVVAPGEETPSEGRTLRVHAAAPCAGPAFQRLLDEGISACAVDEAGRPVAFFDDGEGTGADTRSDPDASFVTTRADLARAGAFIRDRLVLKLMEGGVTFLLPQSVLVDVDVGIGRDTIVYPGVVLEGRTTIGAETVVGPCCRIVNSWVGSGVELKGFNYLSHTSIRNRAILEPHVRRGFD
jgi:bifunctional N-acetylglucosamine-1-phosphate-uridyltransferase/glucosamine-1-phosphate-acetyltransferase GlmU-like protein